jgi:acyl carrier protein
MVLNMSRNSHQSNDLAVFAKLRSWLVSAGQRSGGVRTKEIEMETDLINDGVLDSLEMVNFIMYIEEIRDREIPEVLMQPQYFTSLRVICNTFFHD